MVGIKDKGRDRKNGATVDMVELDFSGLFRGLGEFVQLVGLLAEAGERHIARHGTVRVKGLGDRVHGIYGFTIRSGLGRARPWIEPFGNIQAGAYGLVVDDVREPLVDLVDEDDDMVVTVELPGVGVDEISVCLDGRLLEILTSGERRFAKRVPLPAAVLAGQYEQSYRCGVLKLRIRKRT